MKDIATAENISIVQSVTRDPDYPGLHGRATEHMDKANVDPKNCAVAMCGPPAMYRSMFDYLVKDGYDPRYIFVTLERRMKCGVGKCGHCNIGTATSWKYACKDGPVFGYYEIESIPGLI